MLKLPHIHLLITSAHLGDCEQRKKDYIESFKCAYEFKRKFRSMTILETCSKTEVDYLENSKIKVCYSKFDNRFKNKGINEIIHISEFLQDNDKILGRDIIVKISGRYVLKNTSIIYHFNNDINFVAKDDGDIYNSDGVHTFLYTFRKNVIKNFIEWLDPDMGDASFKEDIPIEVLMKHYVTNNPDCKILDKYVTIGAITPKQNHV